MKEALLWESRPGGLVQCGLCAHNCIIGDGKTGICHVRVNENGTLKSLVYGKAISANIDPIEKKPLFHFLPGSTSFSIATVGCNMSCGHCQNHEISQMPRDSGDIAGGDLPPEDVVLQAERRKAASISYTYTEPTIYFEYALDCARLASARGLKNVFVTNGYMSDAALRLIGGDLHAANVDLKAFTDDFYKKVCGARLEPVKETIAAMKAAGVWVEVTTLLIPGYNDDEKELVELAEWLISVGDDIPWHISRFHPTFKMTSVRSTPVQSIQRARAAGLKAGLKYVYSGNVRGDEGEKTFCSQCGGLLIDRIGFSIASNRLLNGKCPTCDTAASGIWE